MIALLSRLIWLALAGLLPLAFFPSAMTPFSPVKRDVFFILALIQVAVVCLRNAGSLKAAIVRLEFNPGTWPLLGIALAISLSAWLELGPPGGIPALLEPLLGVALALCLLIEADSGIEWKFLAVHAIAVAAASAYALAQFLGLDWLAWQKGFAGGAPPSTYGNPLFLADGIAAALPCAVLGGALSRSGRRFGWWGLSAVLLAALVAAQGRGAWLGVIAAGALLLARLAARDPGALRRNRAPLAALAALAAGMTVALVAAGAVGIGSAEFMKPGASLRNPFAGKLPGRFLLWEASARMVRDRPLAGSGPGQLARRYGEFQGPLLEQPRYAHLPYHSTQHAHFDMLQVAAERGTVGLGLMLWLLAVCGNALFRLPARRARLAAACALCAWLVDGLFNGPLNLPPSSMLFWLLAGIVLRGAWGAPEEEAGSSRLSPRLILAAGIALAVVSRPFGRDLLSEGYLRAGSWMLGAGKHELAAPLALRAFGLRLEDRRHDFVLGEIYYGLEDYSRAAEHFLRDVEANPGAASGWQDLGLARGELGDHAQALEALRRARELNPNDPDLAALIEETRD